MLSETLHNLTPEMVSTIASRVRRPFLDAANQMTVDNDLEPALVGLYIPLAAHLKQLVRDRGMAQVIGINGAQGAGKSTLCRLLQSVLEHGFDLRVTTLSIDDLYLTRSEREELALRIHPLLATRGVPGTHDVALGCQLLDRLRQLQPDQTLQLPAFAKAIDDRLPPEEWREIKGPHDLVLFEGWCVGAAAQPEGALLEPINNLEREEDSDQSWRRFVNRQLKKEYAQLFARLDYLIMLKVPGMASVLRWRSLQEEKLAAATQQTGHRIMSPEALQRFIMHYERITRATLAEMPTRADLVIALNAAHQIDDVQLNDRVKERS